MRKLLLTSILLVLGLSLVGCTTPELDADTRDKAAPAAPGAVGAEANPDKAKSLPGAAKMN